MDTKNKQWNSHQTTSIAVHGQLRPEDLSNRNGQNRVVENVNRPDISTNKDAPGTPDGFNKKGLDHFLAQQVENSICENSRKTILQLLEEISKLSSTEKLLLYLKLPTDVNNVITDPLRQPLNPLGSRTEISQTIMWIRTHLEEDPELSLPKQEVYNEYTMHCNNNKMKPLSTADFGKVMKQVYPSVRPRRLGTRGNSRYCYAGLRKRFKLEVPQLPDLGDRPRSTELTSQSPSELTAAAWYIVQKWAEDTLGTSFVNVCSLALYLVKNVCPIMSTHSAAAALLSNMETDTFAKGDNSDLTMQSNIMNLKHKEAQLQLQRKLQQREVTREQKRKLQLQLSVGKTIETAGKLGGKCKKSKISPVMPDSQQSSLDVCDKTNECVTLPDFSSFQLKKQLDSELNSKDLLPQKPVSTQISRADSSENDGFETSQIAEAEIKPNISGKLPIPRLPTPIVKQALAPPKTVILTAPRSKLRNQPKYKTIQPKPITKCDNFYTQEGISAQVETNDVMTTLGEEQLKDIDILTRERLISVSNVDKDALDDYLHGGNNSQEQEEELLQYFKNNSTEETTTRNVEDEHSNSSKSDKLSQLRLLLEQNLNTPQLPENHARNIFNKTEKQFAPLPTSTAVHSATKRRVSFETSILEDTVPPSPNTRRKNFSFTPISPGPHSPGGRQSKSSSTNASPFVSPRNTPVPRAKTAHVTSATTSFVAQQTVCSRKHAKPTLKSLKHEEVYGNEVLSEHSERKAYIQPIEVMSKCNLPMSAPPSPMLPYKKSTNSNLLQKLLDSNSKIPYVPDYNKNMHNPSQEVNHLMGSTQCFSNTGSYRSQSVPLHQMTSFKTLMSPCMPTSQNQFFNFENNAVTVAATNEFNDFETFPDSDILNNGLNNDNINQILNILDTTPNSLDVSETVPTENIFSFTGSNVISTEIPSFNQLQSDISQTSIQKPIRSLSIDEQIDLRNMCHQKFGQLSRSVPSTPLPYKNKVKPMELNLNNNQMDIFDCSKSLTDEQDYLLNGQPVKKKFLFENTDGAENNIFPTSLGFMINDTNEKLCYGTKVGDSFNARRNLNPLLEQQFAETEEFTTVPNLNSGS